MTGKSAATVLENREHLYVTHRERRPPDCNDSGVDLPRSFGGTASLNMAVADPSNVILSSIHCILNFGRKVPT